MYAVDGIREEEETWEARSTLCEVACNASWCAGESKV
jgi:hypothetical protein